MIYEQHWKLIRASFQGYKNSAYILDCFGKANLCRYIMELWSSNALHFYSDIKNKFRSRKNWKIRCYFFMTLIFSKDQFLLSKNISFMIFFLPLSIFFIEDDSVPMLRTKIKCMHIFFMYLIFYLTEDKSHRKIWHLIFLLQFFDTENYFLNQYGKPLQ